MQAIVMLAALAVAGEEAWGEGEREYFSAVRERGDGVVARRHLERAADWFSMTLATSVPPVSIDSPKLYAGTAIPSILLGRHAEAVAMFRRGLTTRPDDRFLRQQLAIAESQLAGDQNSMPMAFPETRITAAAMSLSAALLTLAAAIAWVWGSRTRRPQLGFVGVLAACLLFLGLAIVYVRQPDPALEWFGTPTVSQPIELRVGNGPNYDPVASTPTLRIGQAVHVIGTRGTWSHVECPDGTTGWLPSRVLIR